MGAGLHRFRRVQPAAVRLQQRMPTRLRPQEAGCAGNRRPVCRPRELNAMAESIVRVDLAQQSDYRFMVSFGGAAPDLLADEPAPLGTGSGPSPVQLLAAAVGNCLSDSLLFSLRKF